jgi:D-sedoheptulose 7-phosphate isomerase
MNDTDFLYPFIDGDERDPDALLADLAASARQKAGESAQLRSQTLAACADLLVRASAAMAESFRSGGRLFTFGNGGSCADAQLAADRFGHGSCTGPALPTLCLADAPAVLSALGNDVGFDLVFARELDAFGQVGDIALGFSTSGGSQNVLRAFRVARDRGMVTVGLSGYGGGAMAASDDLDHCLVVHSQSVHRIQEAQAALVGDLASRVHREIAGSGAQ